MYITTTKDESSAQAAALCLPCRRARAGQEVRYKRARGWERFVANEKIRSWSISILSKQVLMTSGGVDRLYGLACAWTWSRDRWILPWRTILCAHCVVVIDRLWFNMKVIRRRGRSLARNAWNSCAKNQNCDCDSWAMLQYYAEYRNGVLTGGASAKRLEDLQYLLVRLVIVLYSFQSNKFPQASSTSGIMLRQFQF